MGKEKYKPFDDEIELIQEDNLKEDLEEVLEEDDNGGYRFIRLLPTQIGNKKIKLRLIVGKLYDLPIERKPINEKKTEFVARIKNEYKKFTTFFYRKKILRELQQFAYFDPTTDQRLRRVDVLLYLSLQKDFKYLNRISENSRDVYSNRNLAEWNKLFIDEGILPDTWKSVAQIILDLSDCIIEFVEIPHEVLEKLLSYPYEEIALLAMLTMKNKLSVEALKKLFLLRFNSNVFNDHFLDVVIADQIKKGYKVEKIREILAEVANETSGLSLLKNAMAYYWNKYFTRRK